MQAMLSVGSYAGNSRPCSGCGLIAPRMVYVEARGKAVLWLCSPCADFVQKTILVWNKP